MTIEMTDKTQGDVVTVRRHPFNSSEARTLIHLLEAELASLYPDWDDLVHPSMYHYNNPRPPVAQASIASTGKSTEIDTKSGSIIFFVAFAQPDNDAIGCVALRPLPGTEEPLPAELDPAQGYVEVKRLFVLPARRRQGVAKLLLKEIEQYARDDLNLDSVVLEVGLRQEAAVQLYHSAEYENREMFGEYIGADVSSGGDSVCLEKRLRQHSRWEA